ncbi:sugar ABC transporter ATP-binding protein [Microbacterium lacticum]|uniref:sugar ABC transporter ATP-binding protein n=1 Tax=Microbacterium lacticum TaxID=33885 RepID=UPI003A89E716
METTRDNSRPARHLDASKDVLASTLVTEMRGIVKRFGATLALDDAHLAVRRGTTHALVGRNGAGKSTLVSALTGLVEPDAGEVRVDGRELTALERLRTDEIACVYQRPQILDHLTVAENLFIGRGSARWIGRRALHRRAADILAQWGIGVDSHLLARQLDVEQRQLIEIARALTGGPSLVILDEPTAQLDRHASERLFVRLDDMKSKGVSFLFISHHLDELFRVCDEVTVMRDGRTVAASIPVDRLTASDLVDLMVGDTQAPQSSEILTPRQRSVGSGDALLDVRHLASRSGAFQDISFDVNANEIVGLTGLGGSGKREVGQAIVGLHPRTGTVSVAGKALKPNDVRSSITAGVGYVPEDRHASGFAGHLPIADNLVTTVMGELGTLGWISTRKKNTAADTLISDLDIVPAKRSYLVGGLSGGNQQKVVMGRALAPAPKVVVGITPTAGVDVASKQFLYARLERAATEGAAVLIVSDEIDELAIADRVIVMFDGKIYAEFPRGWTPTELIGAIEGVAPAAHSDAAPASSQNRNQ